MRIAIAIYIFAHALAHVVGFLAGWNLMKEEDMPYTTKLFAGAVDVGDVGMRIVGVVWLLTAVAYVAAGVGIIGNHSWWPAFTLYVTILSIVLTAAGWPDAKIGALANAVVLAILVLAPRVDWIPYPGS